jgi:hypothetical protein
LFVLTRQCFVLGRHFGIPLRGGRRIHRGPRLQFRHPCLGKAQGFGGFLLQLREPHDLAFLRFPAAFFLAEGRHGFAMPLLRFS